MLLVTDQQLPELLQRPMLPGQDRSQGFAKDLGDLSKAQAGEVPQMNDPPIGIR